MASKRKRRRNRSYVIGATVRHSPTGRRGTVVGLCTYRDHSQHIEIEYVKGYSGEVVTMWRPKTEFRAVPHV